ncbi:hypothetical protein SAMN05216203_2927 [Marinobacter daqiaonensis]|uniref:Tetratricopeptide repeat-containing protein n=1 Tax=Marinobacter daqiaonensis TaxID=650891 RepID=A0A1I6JDT9_9GAMM|nr:hypothetical protein [Marinobacter daqiaonensis]SFR77136.1 hypothetical protein SAMN05216203_2927 [Marinobacter daqiaonensis]
MAAGLLAGTLLAAATATMALPPEHEIQRLILAVEESVEKERWGEAAEYLNRLQSLEGQKPPQYLYYRGRVMAQSEHYNEAMSALENYIAGTGADGQYYTEALKLITDIEQARARQGGRSNDGSGGEPVAEIRPANGDSPERLQRLYLVDSDRKALIRHMNTLLDLAGWRRDPKVIREGSSPDLHYQVSVPNGEIHFRETRTDDNGNRSLTTHALPVYGVSPVIEWSCENATESCWIYDPRDGSRFLRLGIDRDRAEEISTTLGRLIRLLQQPEGGS